MKFNLGSLHDLKAVGGSMSRAVDKRLIEVQDRVRDHFGWAYSDDLQSARALMEACEAHPRALELGWDTQGREAMLGGLQELLLNAPHVSLQTEQWGPVLTLLSQPVWFPTSTGASILKKPYAGEFR
jgi:hypothetical protein